MISVREKNYYIIWQLISWIIVDIIIIFIPIFYKMGPINTELAYITSMAPIFISGFGLLFTGNWQEFLKNTKGNFFQLVITIYLPLCISIFQSFEYRFCFVVIVMSLIESFLIISQSAVGKNVRQEKIEMCWNQHNKGEDMDYSDIKKRHDEMTAQYKRKLISKERFNFFRKIENQITNHYIKTQQKRILDYVEGLVAERNKQINDLRNNTIFEPNSVTSPYVFYEWYFNMEEVIKYGFELANDLPITILKNKEDPIIELKLLRREAFNRHNYDLNIKDWDKVSSFDEAIAILSELHEEMGNVLIATHLSNYEQD